MSQDVCPSMLVVTAPSGSGKTTIVRHLVSKYNCLRFSVSATTRDAREGEVDGKDYHFLTHEEFRNKVKNDEFIEWEEVYTNQFYGTLKSEVKKLTLEGNIVVFDIEVNGAQNIKHTFGAEAFCLYVAPPSFEELHRRLVNRGTETEETINKRLSRAKKELKVVNRFDKVLVNDDLEYALKLSEQIMEDHLSCNWNEKQWKH